MSKWRIRTKSVPNYGIEIIATRLEPKPSVIRRLTKLGCYLPPTPAELERDIKDWLRDEEKRLPADADNKHAARQLNGKILEVSTNE